MRAGRHPQQKAGVHSCSEVIKCTRSLAKVLNEKTRQAVLPSARHQLMDMSRHICSQRFDFSKRGLKASRMVDTARRNIEETCKHIHTHTYELEKKQILCSATTGRQNARDCEGLQRFHPHRRG